MTDQINVPAPVQPDAVSGEPVAWRVRLRDGSVLKVSEEPFHAGFRQMMERDCGCTFEPLYAAPSSNGELSRLREALDEARRRLVASGDLFGANVVTAALNPKGKDHG
jgi:hypothetical protein